jgi:hypothetical protein
MHANYQQQLPRESLRFNSRAEFQASGSQEGDSGRYVILGRTIISTVATADVARPLAIAIRRMVCNPFYLCEPRATTCAMPMVGVQDASK